MKYLIIIPARKQSKEIKNKNKIRIRIGKLSLIESTLIETILTSSENRLKTCRESNIFNMCIIWKNKIWIFR